MKAAKTLIWCTLIGLFRSTAHSPDEYREPTLGSPADPRRTAQVGIDVGQTTVADGEETAAPSQGWRTFLRNNADAIASMDMLVVPTISFRLLYGILIWHSRRELLWLGVTAHPSAEWIAGPPTEAFGWREAPRYIIRDRDCAYGDAFIRRIGAMGIRDNRSRHDRHGKTDMRRGPSDRSGGTVLITSSSLAKSTFVICSILIKILQRGSDSSITEEGRTDPASHRDREPPSALNTNLGRTSPRTCSSSNLRIELMEDYRVALGVQAGDHPAIRAVHDVAAKSCALRIEVGDERVEIVDLEGDRTACGGARLVLDKIGERDTAAARQIVFNPPFVALVTVQANMSPSVSS